MRWVCCNCGEENDTSYRCEECGAINSGDCVCSVCGALNDPVEVCNKCGHELCEYCETREEQMEDFDAYDDILERPIQKY